MTARQARSPWATLLLAGTLAAAALTPGCGVIDASVDTRGNRVDQEMLSNLVPGVQTRSDVSALLGSPTATNVFGEESWFYIGGVTQNRIGRKDALIDQEVVAVRFDQRGVVQRIDVITMADATRVQPVDRVTPTPGNDVSFLGMLLGNIGRFSPGGAASRQGPGAPGL
ncbi:outer membrane protein assembly factor BamE [Elioraea sp.]|uniref:outer membrane protein assembly factor BamE n=1 Tax=Elioraea sp. TaxID=2185103 RepID=UPI0025C3CD90|nr:outer membrane protein assembly factor BamE [Elioraea sp.]